MPQNHSPFVIVERQQQWLEMTLNRPESFNALSKEMMSELHQAIALANQTSDISCIIIKAIGKAFCAGHDIKQMQSNATQEHYHALFKQCSQLMQSIVECKIPVIAQVQGLATAAGCQLVASCDLAIAADTSKFGVSGINLGLFCSTPAVALSRTIQPKHAMEMLLTGNFIDASRAETLGLINKAVAEDELTDSTRALATKLSEKAPAAIRTGKAMSYPQLQMPLEKAYTFASQHMADNLKDSATQNGLNAFAFKKTKV